MNSEPPTVANTNAQAALNQVASVPEGQPMVRVVRAWKLLQVAGAMFDAGTITEAEYGKFHVFYSRCTAMAAGLPTAPSSMIAGADRAGGTTPPELFRPAMEEVDISRMNTRARMMNARATNSGDVLKPLFCDVKRERYVDFPIYRSCLDNMNETERRGFLQFYNLRIDDDDGDEAQLLAIKRFIGVQLL